MKAVVIFKDNTDTTRTVTDYLRDFEIRTGHVLDTMDPDTEGGSRFCEMYGIVEYPTVVAVSDSGVMQSMWSGLPLPTITELSYYVSQNN
jgi:hypothetical protein